MSIETLLLILVILIIISIVLSALLFGKNPRQGVLQLEERFGVFERGQEKFERTFRDEIAKNREEARENAVKDRTEAGTIVKLLGDSLLLRMTEIATLQKNQLELFSSHLTTALQNHDKKLDQIRETVEVRLKLLQDENSAKLEQMRSTVDEKLHATLEQRLGESFKFVSERLELVHKGLGEMQTLAQGVGDLKKVLTNVKTRGIWGEIQLGALLEQILTPEQYERNVVTKKDSRERVEFAIKLPGRDNNANEVLWLPIDAKFPQEAYYRLIDALERGDIELAEEATKQLELTIKNEAIAIKDKYLDPPNTTDFGIMFLPTEGLYAEVLRRSSLWETLQRDYRVIVTGPTTLAAILNSLQVGFRTLTIEKRSSEVWALLGAVKTQFGRFGDILEKTQKKLTEASNTIDDAVKKSRTIERKLKNVEALPVQDVAAVSMLDSSDSYEE